MSSANEFSQYDDILSNILVNEKSILGFLSAIFNFLARRTDFYYVPDGQYENIGFPPGVAEELVIKVLRTCDPKNVKEPHKHTDLNNEIMCSTVAQEVEVIASEDTSVDLEASGEQDVLTSEHQVRKAVSSQPEEYKPPVIPIQKRSECYNGADRENYSWAQTLVDLDVTVKLPPDIKSSKDLKVAINPGDIYVCRQNGDVIVKDSLLFKIKTSDSFWSLSEGRLLMHLEKVREQWWSKLLIGEEDIDLSKIDCSRPLHELPDDHIDKIKELQWNQEQKMKGLPTSDEIRNIEILKKAWNADGSPFKGQKFDPSILSQSFTPFGNNK
ncbi:nudC domain-containing protein 3 [Bombyx mandarina]|uniref:NudC domain-containing protein 3 n=1 Tax=Bombyx mandarina TaxID=7092 RepID=A0A6J2KUV3_BOMMA|nr:nudC domain-containing protein 3 [Bombyx mandarina]